MPFEKEVLGIVFSAAFLISGCKEDADEAANALFVEAASAVSEARTITGEAIEEIERKQTLLAGASGNLAKIVDAYPTSALAVDLAGDGEANGLAVDAVNDEYEATSGLLKCLQANSCFVESVYQQEKVAVFSAGRRTDVILFLAANAKWGQAVSLITPDLDVENTKKAEALIIWLAVLYGEYQAPELKDLLTRSFPSHDFDKILQEIKDLEATFESAGWRRTGEVRVIQGQSETASNQDFGSLQIDLDLALRAGSVEKIQTSLFSMFQWSPPNSDQSSSNEDHGVFSSFVYEIIRKFIRSR